MNRKEVVRRLQREGCVLIRHGARHDLYKNPANGLKQPVPRHHEIHDRLAQHIMKALGIK